MDGRVEHLLVASKAQAGLEPVQSVLAVAGRGLDGDRYFLGEGSFSQTPGTGRQVTLIESEAISAVCAEEGIELAPADMRRNIVTSGVALSHLVGREFCVGAVRLRGMRLAEPCAHLSRLAGHNLTVAMLHRAGLRADIVDGGEIHVGDRIVPVADGS